ncbi:DUF4179 domain-containing protein [Anoxybacterium hadale]|uniref:DUF4179 domain-containing protein n=1 Tax=Anoxybacterium hadale TaxID=3408580 RepID=A0ACD1ABE2_9FIRM|nr:DUF4179 domain-containing protein [Clostridiales bacterium]
MNQIYSMLNDIKTDPDSYEREELSEVDQKRILKDLKASGRLDNGCTQPEAAKIRSRFHQSGTNEIGSHLQQSGTGKASRSSFLKAGTGKLASAAICGFIAAIMIGGIAYADEIQAAAKSASWQIASYLGIEKELDDYVTVVSTSRSSKGYTVTLNEVILDHDELLVSSTVQSGEKMDDGLHASANIYINGKRASESAGGSLRKIDEQTLESVISYKLNEQYTADPLDFEIKYDFTSPEGKEINGNWDFRFKASGTALAADTIHIPLQVSYRLPNGELIQLTEFTSNSIGSKIYFQSVEPSKEEGRSYDMNLEGTDQMGNKVIFYLSYRNQERGAFKLSEPLLDSAEVLSLQPYAVAFPEKSGRLSNDFKPVGESFDLSLDR